VNLPLLGTIQQTKVTKYIIRLHVRLGTLLTLMSWSPSHRLPTPLCSPAPHRPLPPPPRSNPSLNPDAAPFSPSSAAPGGDLPKWLLFNPSYSEVRSLVLGHQSNASPVPSFAEVVKGEGAVVEDPKCKAPLDPAL
jgi:hypothetical protein